LNASPSSSQTTSINLGYKMYCARDYLKLFNKSFDEDIIYSRLRVSNIEKKCLTIRISTHQPIALMKI
jgi:hypothetical protein